MTYELVTMYKGEEIRRTEYDREFDLLCAKAKLEAAGYSTYTILVQTGEEILKEHGISADRKA